MTLGDNPLPGTWKLRSHIREDVETGDKSHPFGTQPVGYLNYSPDGRMMVMFVSDNRKAPAEPVPTDPEMIALFKTVIAYAGAYNIEGNRVTHNVDVSWDEAWTGTKQTRFFKLDGKLLTLTSAPLRNRQDGRMSVFTLVWEKIE